MLKYLAQTIDLILHMQYIRLPDFHMVPRTVVLFKSSRCETVELLFVFSWEGEL